ncbi:MAG: hypothetical protein EON54_23520 [Alcaligenaceae bacterium]|nr:MAG: hypothetical protein EON54_23520 [Alcaligenaceae bacterium]
MKPCALIDSDDKTELELGRRLFACPGTEKAWHAERSHRDTFWTPAFKSPRICRRAYNTRYTSTKRH